MYKVNNKGIYIHTSFWLFKKVFLCAYFYPFTSFIIKSNKYFLSYIDLFIKGFSNKEQNCCTPQFFHLFLGLLIKNIKNE